MGTVEPLSTNTPWSAAQPPSKGTEKNIHNDEELFFFQTCYSKALVFCLIGTSPGLLIPNGIHPRVPRA